MYPYSHPAPEARAFRIQGTGATVGGTTNTNVVAFTGAPAVHMGTKASYLGTTFVAPTGGSGLTYNVVNDAAFGTVVKVCKRGIYLAQIDADGTLSDTAGAQIGITLDLAAAQLLVGAGTVTALSDIVLGYQNTNGVTDAAIPAKAVAEVYITDALAAGAQPTAVAGATGVGCIRFIANNGANAVVATAYVAASIRATVVWQNDLAG
jgi:hypothetical protein